MTLLKGFVVGGRFRVRIGGVLGRCDFYFGGVRGLLDVGICGG